MSLASSSVSRTDTCSSNNSFNSPDTLWLSTGDYRLLSVLGTGTSGVVYEGIEIFTGRNVAIKVSKHRNSPGFGNECRLQQLMASRSTAVMPCHQALTIDAKAVLITDVGSCSAQSLVGKLNPRAFRWFLHDLSDALVAAHDAGIYHCDVKPEQVLAVSPQAGQRQKFVLADWGGASETRFCEVRGSPSFCEASSWAALCKFESDPVFWEKQSTTADRFHPDTGIWIDGESHDCYAFALTLLNMLVGDCFMPQKKDDVSTFIMVLQEDREWFLARFSEQLTANALLYFAWALNPDGNGATMRQYVAAAKAVGEWLL